MAFYPKTPKNSHLLNIQFIPSSYLCTKLITIDKELSYVFILGTHLHGNIWLPAQQVKKSHKNFTVITHP